jgi:hypothetical protein
MAGAGSSILVEGAAGSSSSFAYQSAHLPGSGEDYNVRVPRLYDVLSSLPCFLL